MINYKGPGIVHAYAPANIGVNIHVIVVERPGAGNSPSDYVTSLYVEGDAEWVSGHYFKTRSEAVSYFTWILMERMPIQHIDIYPEATEIARKLHKFLDALENSNECS